MKMKMSKIKASALKTALAGTAKNPPKVHMLPKESGSRITESRKSGNYFKPDLYLNDKDFPGIGTWKVGDKVVLCIECGVKGMSMRDGHNRKEYNVTLEIDAISDITAGGKK